MQVELIKAIQKEKGITNKAIAEKAKLSESTVSRILSHQVEAKFEDVVRIAVAVGVSVDAIAGIVREESGEVKELKNLLAEKDAQLAEKDNQLLTYEKIVNTYDKLLAEKDGGSAYLKSIIKTLAVSLAVLVLIMILDLSAIAFEL